VKSAISTTGVADLCAQPRHFLVRQPEELLQQAELMDGVAAEIAQEIGVFLQHSHPDAGARLQKAEHHAGRAAANHTAGGRDPAGIHRERFSVVGMTGGHPLPRAR
jgi:hypothetical protein